MVSLRNYTPGNEFAVLKLLTTILADYDLLKNYNKIENFTKCTFIKNTVATDTEQSY